MTKKVFLLGSILILFLLAFSNENNSTNQCKAIETVVSPINLPQGDLATGDRRWTATCPQCGNSTRWRECTYLYPPKKDWFCGNSNWCPWKETGCGAELERENLDIIGCLPAADCY